MFNLVQMLDFIRSLNARQYYAAVVYRASFIVLFAIIFFNGLSSAWAQAGGRFYCDAQFYQIRVNSGNDGTRLLRYPTFASTPSNLYGAGTSTVPGLEIGRAHV